MSAELQLLGKDNPSYRKARSDFLMTTQRHNGVTDVEREQAYCDYINMLPGVFDDSNIDDTIETKRWIVHDLVPLLWYATRRNGKPDDEFTASVMSGVLDYTGDTYSQDTREVFKISAVPRAVGMVVAKHLFEGAREEFLRGSPERTAKLKRRILTRVNDGVNEAELTGEIKRKSIYYFYGDCKDSDSVSEMDIKEQKLLLFALGLFPKVENPEDVPLPHNTRHFDLSYLGYPGYSLEFQPQLHYRFNDEGVQTKERFDTKGVSKDRPYTVGYCYNLIKAEQ